MSGILGQSKPLATTWTTLYTVPSAIVASVRVIISNLGPGDSTFRVALSPDGDAIVDKHRVTGGDEAIGGDKSGSTIAFVLNPADVIRVYSGDGNVVFTATGETRPE